LMGMASFTSNKLQISKEFKTLKSKFDELKQRRKNVKIISMGMSGDYKLAIDCGSNMIRVGSLIFGARNYN
ncbi:MAG: YggS family pyridoxal phosphate-dependent enzyme, partial [Bacteroidota bacterium]|nr:YggS family pyridoxal phosphate-dependent enzyme [Bacteroidota bacterium]